MIDTRLYEKIPEGWAVREGAQTAPLGTKWIWNRKSMFGGECIFALLMTDRELYEETKTRRRWNVYIPKE